MATKMGDQQLGEAIRRFLRGEVNPIQFAMGYEQFDWPAPWWALVMLEPAFDPEKRKTYILNHCPHCQSGQQEGPTDQPPPHYHCDNCGFTGVVPLRRYWEVLGEKLFELQFRVYLHGRESRVSLKSPEIPENRQIIEELRQEIAGEVQARVSALQCT